MTKEAYQKVFLNKENEMLACRMYGFLISSDTLRSVEDCEKSKEEAEQGALARCHWLGINKETIVTINKKRKKRVTFFEKQLTNVKK